MDPCDLRLKSGDGALRDLVARRTPLFEFAIRTALAEHDLDNAEGRVAALRRCVPMVARIKDRMLRDEYAAPVGRLGRLGRRGPSDRAGCARSHSQRRQARVGAGNRGPSVRSLRPRSRPWWHAPIRGIRRCGRSARRSKSALQYAALAGPVFDALTVESFTHPGYAAVQGGHRRGGRHLGRRLTGAQWIEAVRAADRLGRPPAWSTSWASESINVGRRRQTAALHRWGAGSAAGSVRSAARSPRSSPSCSACRRWNRATNITRCSATWSRWRPIGAACSEQASGDDLTA